MITLDSRLYAAAELVRKDTVFADIGTDHAYLPIHLIQSGKCTRGYASDLRKGPLQSAVKNLNKYGCADNVECILSDGLKAYGVNSAEDYIIAGMGGELIAKILDNAPFEITSRYNFILQPMTREEELRQYLTDHGFSVLCEKAVSDKDKSYIIILANKNGAEPTSDRLYKYVGKLDLSDSASRQYVLRKINSLKKRLKGLNTAELDKEAEKVGNIIKYLEARLNEN